LPYADGSKLAPVDHVADRLLIELEQGGDVFYGEQFVWIPARWAALIWHPLNLIESNGRRLVAMRTYVRA